MKFHSTRVNVSLPTLARRHGLPVTIFMKFASAAQHCEWLLSCSKFYRNWTIYLQTTGRNTFNLLSEIWRHCADFHETHHHPTECFIFVLLCASKK